METNKKIIGNAMISYFLIFICLSFFLNKENEAINNHFVKSHTKTAFAIHCLFLLVYILFVSLGIGSGIAIVGFSLSAIIASSLFIALFALLMYGMYKAHSGKTFTVSEMMSLTKTGKIIEINENKDLSEQDKFAIIISYIPFLGYITYGKYQKLTHIHDIVFVNLIASFIIALFFVLTATNIALVLMLLYVIFVAFSIVTLLTKDEIFHLNTSRIPTPTQKLFWQKTGISYLVSHIRGKEFTGLKSVYAHNAERYVADEQARSTVQQKLPDMPLAGFIAYIPVVNIICIPFIRSRYHYHIINGLVITVLFIILAVVSGFQYMVPLTVLFPMSFGIGYLSRLGYQMPYIYNLYAVLASILYTITHLFSQGKAIHQKKETITLKTEKTIVNKEETTK